MSAVSAADRSSSSTPQQADAGAVVQETSREEQLDDAGQGGEDQRGTPEEHEDSRDVEVVEGGGKGGGVPVIIEPALVYTKKGEVVEVDQNIVGAVDLFRAPDGFVRKGRREQSFMYSLGVYVEEKEGGNHRYFCMADAACRRAMKVVPCRKGDRSNVNTHLKSKHGLQGSGGVKKEENKRQSQEGIKACFEASRNSGVGTNRCVLCAVYFLSCLFVLLVCVCSSH